MRAGIADGRFHRPDNMTKLVMLDYTGAMRTAKISELKAKLSAHIEYVKRGEEILILDRNPPGARRVPAGQSDDENDRTSRLIAKGILTPAKMPRPAGFKLPKPTGRMISDEAMEQVWREERDGR